MSVRQDAERDSYDVVVIGSGLGGLTAAALLARWGRRVLVVERHDRIGGYAHAFTRRRHRFDSAVHLVAGGPPVTAGNPGIVPVLLDLLGVADRLEFHRLDPFYRVVLPGFQLDVPAGPDFLDAHAARFPAERVGLRRMQRLSTLLTREAQRLPPDLPTAELHGGDFPLLSRYRRATVSDVLDEHLSDARLKTALTALWPYLGVPPSVLAFDVWSLMITTYLEFGAYYCAGSFQRLVDAFGAGVTDNGGEVMVRTAARRILVERGRVTGVVLDNGQRVTAQAVVSNADPLQTCEELVGTENVDGGYLALLRSMRCSLSAAVLYLATGMDLGRAGMAHETFVFDGWDHDATYAGMLTGAVPALTVSVPTLSDPSLSRDGMHLVTAVALLPYDAVASWRHSKPRYERLIMDRLEELVPGIGSGAALAEGGTPRTMERYTLNLRGAIYGWEHAPDQTGTGRLPHRTPVEGLYLSGHWTQPGGGVLSVISSGVQTAEMLTGASVLERPRPVSFFAGAAG
ncbi:phytoene desaturase family protein [Frankia sp. CiP1_Cm_nod1]|uniref:phytoene desaturase family protein n=1 Tax=Frankia sp. CiP1_Cm_nod1 TaxID=2897160 RepID=UPI002023D247